MELVAEARGFIGGIRSGLAIGWIDVRLARSGRFGDANRRTIARALRHGFEAVTCRDKSVDATLRDRTVSQLDIVWTPGHGTLLQMSFDDKKRKKGRLSKIQDS